MFEEIDKVKLELPKGSKVYNNITKKKYNGFQYITFIIGLICFVLGIIFGNVFPACGQSSTFYSEGCVSTEFNVSLMIAIWFISFILCMFLYGIGEIIRLLSENQAKTIKK